MIIPKDAQELFIQMSKKKGAKVVEIERVVVYEIELIVDGEEVDVTVTSEDWDLDDDDDDDDK